MLKRLDSIARMIETSGFWRTHLKWLLLLLAFVPAAGAIDRGFLRGYDDFWVMEFNPLIQKGWSVRQLFAEGQYAYGHMQLAYISFAIDHFLFGEHVMGFRIVNALLHGLNALLVYAAARRFLRLAGGDGQGRPSYCGGEGPALLAAFVFVVHPTVVESVAWVMQRNGLLAQFFGLCAITVYLRGGEKTEADAVTIGKVGPASVPAGRDAIDTAAIGGPSLARACAAAALLLLAQFSKTIAVGLAPAFMAFELFMFRDALRRRVLRGALMMIPCAAGVWIGLSSHAEQVMPLIGGDSPAGRISGALHLHGRAWGLLAFPLALSTFYHVSPFPGLLNAAAGIALLIPAALAALFRALKWETKAALALWIWITGALAPAMNPFTGISFVLQDRYTYLALPPFCILLALLLSRAVQLRTAGVSPVLDTQNRRDAGGTGWRGWPWAAAGALVLALAVVSVRRSLAWQDERTVFSDACRQQPESSFGHAYLASYLYDRAAYMEGSERREMHALALSHHETAMRCDDFERLVYPMRFIAESIELYGAMGQAQAARELALRVLDGRAERNSELGSKARAARFLAAEALASKQFDLARAYINLGLSLEPGHECPYEAHPLLGLLGVELLQAEGKREEAERELRRLLEDLDFTVQIKRNPDGSARLKEMSSVLLKTGGP